MSSAENIIRMMEDEIYALWEKANCWKRPHPSIRKGEAWTQDMSRGACDVLGRLSKKLQDSKKRKGKG